MKGRLRQIYTTVTCSIAVLAMSALNVWPSYTTLIYASNETTPLSAPITEMEGSLLGSLPSLGVMLGASLAGTIIDKLGRKNGGIVLSLPYIISWAIIGVSTNIKIILAARFLAGMGGGFFIVTPIFISEVSDPSIRGTLAITPVVFYSSGGIFSTMLGWFFSYHTVIWINLSLSVLCTLMTAMVVESPVYLLRQRRDEDARQSIAKYRGLPLSSLEVADEFSQLKQQIMSTVELATSKDVESSEVSEKEKLRVEEEKLRQPISESKSPVKTLCLQASNASQEFASESSSRNFIDQKRVKSSCLITAQLFC